MQPLTKYQFLALATLLRQPMHAYAVRQEIIELTSHYEWPAHSTVRETLKALQTKDLIEECQTNPNYWLKARLGVPYELTDRGYWVVRRELSLYYEIFVKSWRRLEKFDD